MDYNKYEFKEAVDDSQIAYLDCVETGYDALYTGKTVLENILSLSRYLSCQYKL
jgi:hypothetical protein